MSPTPFHSLPDAATARQDLLPRPEERLPFTVRVVTDTDTLSKAIDIRRAAYGRHIPTLAATMGAPERHDNDPGAVVLLAESKLDGAPLGTMRIQTNRNGPLWLEQSVELPDWLQGKSLAEATRLGTTAGTIGRLTKHVLFKAYYLYCVSVGIEWMVIAGRSPLDRQYDALLFEEVFPGAGYIPMRHAGNIPHRVLAFHIPTAQAKWEAADHPLYDFIVRTVHPDITIIPTVSPAGDLSVDKLLLAAARGLEH